MTDFNSGQYRQRPSPNSSGIPVSSGTESCLDGPKGSYGPGLRVCTDHEYFLGITIRLPRLGEDPYDFLTFCSLERLGRTVLVTTQ